MDVNKSQPELLTDCGIILISTAETERTEDNNEIFPIMDLPQEVSLYIYISLISS